MGDTWTPPASDKVQAGAWTPPASDRVGSGSGFDYSKVGHVRPDMTDHEILTAGLGYPEAKAQEIMSAPGYKPGMLQGAVSDPNGLAATVGHTILGSLYKGAVADPSVALGQLASHVGTALGLNDPRNTELRDAMVQLGKANYQQNWKGNTGYNAATGEGAKTSATDFVGQGVGAAIPYVVTEGKNPAALTGKLLSKEALPVLGKMAVQGGVYGALQPVTQPTDSFAGQKLEQAGLGAVGGVAGGAIGQKVIAPALQKFVAPAVSKIGNAITGKMSPMAQELQALGDKYGVRLSVGDITQNPLAQKAEVMLDSVPGVGTAGFRQAQQGEAQTAAQQFADSLKAKLGDDDWTKTVQNSLKSKVASVSATKNDLYDQVAQAAGDKKLGLPKTLGALDQASQQNSVSALPDPAIQNTIDTLKQRLYQGRDEAGKILAPDADTTFTGMQTTRSDLNDQISKLVRAGDAKGVRILKGIKDAINSDMQDFATKSGDPDLLAKWKAADSYYKNSYVPLKDKAITNAIQSSTPDEIYASFIQSGKGDRAANFYNALDNKGQDAIRYGMVNDALTKATNPNGTFSPAKFAGSINRMSAPASSIFKGEDKWELDGFTKLMQHVTRAGQFAENPPTGNRLLPLLMGGGAALHPEGAAVAGASALGLRTLLTTAAGKRLLLAASDASVGSPAMNRITQQITTLLGAKGGSGIPTPLKTLIPIAAQNDQLNQPLQITDLRPQVPQ